MTATTTRIPARPLATSTPPFVQFEPVHTWPDDYGRFVVECRAVYHHGVYVGEVVYERRRRRAPAGSPSSTGYVTHYGWRPAKASKSSKLTSYADAVERLAHYPHEVDQ